MFNNVFRALNDPTRREILELLKNREMIAGEIADKFDISKPSISHHLDILKQADLVVGIKRGQFIYYSINTSVMEEFIQWILKYSQSKN